MSKPVKPVAPAVPIRGERTTFSARTGAFLSYMSNELAPYVDNMGTWIEGEGVTITALKDDATTAKNQSVAAQFAAEQYASNSQDYSQQSAASANFKGLWVNLAGALNVPASTFHESDYWMLTVNVANVSAHEPGDSANWERLVIFQQVRTPTPSEPLSGATGVTLAPALTADGYASIYSSDARAVRRFQVDVAAGDWLTPAYEASENADAHTVATPLIETTNYKWRCRDESAAGANSLWSAVQTFSTGSISVNQPTLTVEGATLEVPESPTLETGAFATTPAGQDSHLNTDWQILDDQLTVVWESLADASNKLSIVVPAGELLEDTTYTFRVRHRGTTYGESTWASVVATTIEIFGIGDPGAEGFGVGVYPETLPTGFSALTGTTDSAHDNYGNYKYDADDSICCFVPKFYYRIGHIDNPTYTDYGVNSIDIKGAPAAGYVLHRAFTDGGAEKHGFFFDKYTASKNGTTSGKSVKNGVPISLTTSTTYTRSDGMTGCTGILADAVVLSRARGAGVWQCASIFAWSAIRMISLAHAQASAATTNCAWYDSVGNTNFPKGCNDGALSDVNDVYNGSTNPNGVIYTTAGDSGNASKPLTGSGVPFAKTTHNGQANGISDVNGGMYELAIGMTMPGATATDNAYDTTTTSVWVLKESVEIATLTGGWNDNLDSEVNAVWQHAGKISTLYAQIDIGLGHNVNEKFGDGTNQVLSGGSTGSGYTTDSLGWPKDANGHSATGTNLFGTDQWYLRHSANQAPLLCGYWSSVATAGVWYSYVGNGRSFDLFNHGFRSFAYGS